MRSVHAVSGSSSPARSARMVAMSCELRMSSVSGPSRVPAETAIGSMVVNSVSRRSGRTVDVLAAGGGTHVSAEAGQSSRWGRGARLTRRVREEYPVYFDRNARRTQRSGVVNSRWWNPRERRGRRGARLTRRVREEYLVYFDRNATMSGAQRRGQPGWIAGRTPRGFHHRLFGRDGSPAEPPPGELGRVGFATGC